VHRLNSKKRRRERVPSYKFILGREALGFQKTREKRGLAPLRRKKNSMVTYVTWGGRNPEEKYSTGWKGGNPKV